MPPIQYRWLAKFLKIFFHLLYHQFAWTYDLVSGIVSLGMWNSWIRSSLPKLPGPRVLELGHGPGHLQSALFNTPAQAFGLDLSPQMGKLAVQRLKRIGHSPRLTNADTKNLPYPANTFDQLVATFPTEYIVDPETITETHRVLKTGGQVIIIPVAWITGQSFFHRLAAWLFKITGQAGEITDDIYTKGLAQYETRGFNLQIEKLPHKQSTILMLTATKR
ncbi:class I SAM-dependent methyltransferase [Chloroflexota bacterium]